MGVNADPKDPRVKQDLLVFLDAPETKDHKEILDCRVLPDLADYPAHPDKLDQLELPENAVQWEKLVQWVLKAQLDLEAKLVHLELRVKGEKEVKVEAKVLRVIVVFSVFKVFPVLWVLKETKVPLVFLVPLVNLVKQVHPVLLVLLDLLDLLANRWAMTLLLWLQSLDKVKLRVPILWPVMIRHVYSLN